jgi:hypothetical protein
MKPTEEMQEARKTVYALIRRGDIQSGTSCAKCSETGRMVIYHPDPQVHHDFMWICRKCYHQMFPISPQNGDNHANSKCPPFEVMWHEIRVKGLSWTEFGEKYHVTKRSAYATWRRRCNKRGVSYKLSPKEVTDRKVRAGRTLHDKKSISARALFDEIFALMEEYQLTHADVTYYYSGLTYPNKKYLKTYHYLWNILNKKTMSRVRVPFKTYDQLQLTVEKIRWEYAYYHQIQESTRRRALDTAGLT